MDTELLKARLNLHAVLRNLEDLPVLDSRAAAMIRDWRTAIHFSVRGGLHAGLVFEGGQCRHYAVRPPRADVRLFFFSPAHANGMFAGTANPVPLKGFSRLGFLKNEFTELTRRLEYFLKPDAERLTDPGYLRANTILTIFTGAFAVKHLAELEPVSAQLAAAVPNGSVQLEVEPDGPLAHIIYDGKSVVPRKGAAARPSAIMWFAYWRTANDVLNGKMDAFSAAGKGLLRLEGKIPIIDNTGLIMDRAAAYLA